MKFKTLNKRIHRLEMRLQEGPGKLAKLKRKLEAMTAAKAKAAKRKLATRALKAPGRTKKKKRPAPTKTQARPAAAKKTGAQKKAKRKLNLSPERRAQLAAAMKARWAAKRAALATSSGSN